MEFRIPEALKSERQELEAGLAEAAKATGPIGAAARSVAATLQPHLGREDAFALPPLILLPLLCTGAAKTDMADVLPMTDRLKTELMPMLDDHRDIVACVRRLRDVAQRRNNARWRALAERLLQRLQVEEEVLYPAALLVGECVRVRCGGYGSALKRRPSGGQHP